jgi:hypothetical protein
MLEGVRPPDSGRSLFAGVFVVSWATLVLEVSLIRLLSFVIWHHFGYVIISTALLGFAAAGTLLAVIPRIGTRDLHASLARCCVLAAIATLGTLGVIAFAQFDPMQIFSSRAQAALFVAYLIAAALPFFFSGLVVSLALRAAAARVDRLYFWDLLGAGIGCATAIVLMNLLTPPGAAVVAAAGFVAAAAVMMSAPITRAACVAACLGLLAAATAADRVPFTPSASKEMALQQAFGSVHRFTRWTALFRTDVFEQPRRTPTSGVCREFGVSPLAPADCHGPRLIIGHDATAGAPMYALRDHDDLSYLDYDVLRVPYLVSTPRPKVLVIGVGGGRDVVVANRFGASSVVGVELDPATIDVIRDVMNDVSDGFFRRPEIRLVADEGRHFVRTSGETFDLIQITAVDTLAAEFSGAYVLAENYLYTADAIQDFLDHLNPGGMLSLGVSDIDANAPKSVGRMVSVVREALERRGIEHPGQHIAIIDSKRLATEILVRREPFDAAEVTTLADHATKMRFVPLWLPGGASHPVYRDLIESTGAARTALFDRLPFLVTPTTDDRPFFFFFFRWTGLFKPGKLTPSHVSALSQIVLAALLLTLSALGTLFVLGPLVVLRRAVVQREARAATGILVYFLAVGIGFMLFEISLIQRFVLFLGYPTYSLTVTLFSLLVSLGCGSFVSKRWVGRERVVLPVSVALIGVFALFYTFVAPTIQASLLASSLAVRVAAATAMIAPLGVVLGAFLPLGIRHAAAVHEDLVPWAWGVNGCASVTGGVLAVVLAATLGFRAVWMLSIATYAGGVAALLWSSGMQARRAEPDASPMRIAG